MRDNRATLDVGDSELPGIGIALDVQVMAHLLESIPGPDLPTIIGGEIDYIRYKPGTSLIAGYRFDTRSKGEPGEIRGYGKLVRPDRVESAWGKAAAIAARRSYARVVQLEPLPLLFHFYPYDREIRGLRIASDTRKMNHRLPALWSEECGDYLLARELTTSRLVRYKPERRAVFKTQAVFRDRGSVRETETRLHVKAYADETGESTYRLMLDLGGEALHDFPRLARPRHYDPVHRILYQDHLDGIPLLEIPDVCVAASRTGHCLARFHASAAIDAGGRVPRSIHQAMGEACAVLHFLAGVAKPDLQPQIRRLIRSLRKGMPAETTLSLIHGDFHQEQVMVQGEAIGFVDFDEARPGDPRFDAANFIAHLRAGEVSGSHTASERQAIEAAFLDGYASGGGRTESLGWFIAAGLARLAVRPFRSGQPEWREESSRLVGMGLEAS